MIGNSLQRQIVVSSISLLPTLFGHILHPIIICIGSCSSMTTQCIFPKSLPEHILWYTHRWMIVTHMNSLIGISLGTLSSRCARNQETFIPNGLTSRICREGQEMTERQKETRVLFWRGLRSSSLSSSSQTREWPLTFGKDESQCEWHSDTLCLDATLLSFRGKVCKQIQGTAIGSPVSVVVMEDVEQRALLMFHSPPWF